MAVLYPLQHLSDRELLGRLCSEDDDAALYQEFVKRFLEDVKSRCLKISKQRKLDDHTGTQIAHECFEKVRKYKSFKVDEIKISDSRKAVMAYLNRVIVNLFNDYQDAVKRKESLVINKTYFDDLLGDARSNNSPEELQKIKEKTMEILRKLNPGEQKVLLRDLEYKRSQKYLPDDITELLATELGVKKDTIRKIRQRVILKLKTVIHGV